MASTSSLRGERKRKLKSEINVVPYIDVMLVLLVIFMVTAPMTNPTVINLPTAGQSTQPPKEYIAVNITKEGSVSITLKNRTKGSTKTTTGVEDLPNRLALMQRLKEMHQQNPEISVLLSADKDIKYDEVVQIIAEAKKLGINRVGLATK